MYTKLQSFLENVAVGRADVNPAQHLDGDLTGTLAFHMYAKMYAL
jgi:hypothetical protein